MPRKKTKPTKDAVKILHRRHYEGKPKRLANLDNARANDQVARKIVTLRTQADLSQRANVQFCPKNQLKVDIIACYRILSTQNEGGLARLPVRRLFGPPKGRQQAPVSGILRFLAAIPQKQIFIIRLDISTRALCSGPTRRGHKFAASKRCGGSNIKRPVLGNRDFIEWVKTKLDDRARVEEQKPESRKVIGIEVGEIARVTATVYGKQLEELGRKGRGEENEARSIAMYLYWSLGGHKLSEIGRVLGLDKTSSVSSACFRDAGESWSG